MTRNRAARSGATWFRDQWGEIRIGWCLAPLAAAIPVIVVVVLACVNVAARHYEATGCRGYGAATGRPTEFVSYSWWNYECLVQLEDGRWVNKDHGSRIETGR